MDVKLLSQEFSLAPKFASLILKPSKGQMLL